MELDLRHATVDGEEVTLTCYSCGLKHCPVVACYTMADSFAKMYCNKCWLPLFTVDELRAC